MILKLKDAPRPNNKASFINEMTDSEITNSNKRRTSAGLIHHLNDDIIYEHPQTSIFNSHFHFQNEMKPITKRSEPVTAKIKKKISTSVFFRNGKESVQNEAFENIGDDDL